MSWSAVEAVLVTSDVKSIAWDGCHKIYVLLDDEQTAQMISHGYGEDGSYLHLASEVLVLDTLREWWDESCGLRFISAVRTNHDNPNAGFTDLISQFEDDE